MIWALMYIQIISVCYTLFDFQLKKYFLNLIKSWFSKMACRALWNTSSDESLHSDVSSEIDFMYSTKESEYKDVEWIFCNGNFSEDERGENWIKCFCCSLWGHLDLPQQRQQNISVTFINRFEVEICIILIIWFT